MKRRALVTLALIAALVQGAHAQQRLPPPMKNLPRLKSGSGPFIPAPVTVPLPGRCDWQALLAAADQLIEPPPPAVDPDICYGIVCEARAESYRAWSYHQRLLALDNARRACH